jgi:hypothetical protein
MKEKDSNKKFVSDFITESYKILHNKIKTISENLSRYEDEDDEIRMMKSLSNKSLSAEELFGDESIQAMKDIEAEYGEEEIAPFGSMEDAGEFVKSVTTEEQEIDEERIANPKAKEHVNKLENFIGSHIYGEDLGGLGQMYVAYSYGEQFPVYVHYKNKWYHNTDSYMLDGNEVNDATEKHKKDMKPSSQTSGMSLRGLQSMISAFKKKNGITGTNHKDVEPGEKN